MRSSCFFKRGACIERGNVSTLKDSSAGKETVSEALRWRFSIFQRRFSLSHSRKHISKSERQEILVARADPHSFFVCARPKFRRQEKWKRSAAVLLFSAEWKWPAINFVCVNAARRTPCRPLVCLLCMFAPNRRCKDWRLEQSCLCVRASQPESRMHPQRKLYRKKATVAFCDVCH